VVEQLRVVPRQSRSMRPDRSFSWKSRRSSARLLLRLCLGVALRFRTGHKSRGDGRRDDRKKRDPLQHHKRTNEPAGRVLGVTSPYPTVVTVCSAHHMPSQMLEDVVASLAGRFLAPDWLAATAGPSS
jgi:hypothetical protein